MIKLRLNNRPTKPGRYFRQDENETQPMLVFIERKRDGKGIGTYSGCRGDDFFPVSRSSKVLWSDEVTFQAETVAKAE